MHSASDVDLLSSNATPVVLLELTSNCNLRCVYCSVSQPTHTGNDLALDDFEDLIQTLKERSVRSVIVNGTGETTFIPGWHRRVDALADHGFQLSITSNFAKLFTPEELETMARMDRIVVSIDTHNPSILRKIRRRVDLGNVLINMMGVITKSRVLGLPPPEFSWSCVLTDRVAHDFLEYIHFGIACGVKNFTICNLVKLADIDGAEQVQHVTTLETKALVALSNQIDEASRLVAEINGALTVVPGLIDSIREELVRRAR
jgi:molybdenum cofactor biosynthesis enzyme MoaA